MNELVRFNRRMSPNAIFRTIGSVVIALGVATTAAAQPPSPAPSAPAVIQRACLGCHELSVAAGKGRTPQEWADTIDRMTDRGVDATDVELAAVKAYLAKALPPGTQGPPKELQAQ
jgi:hypothetical protein